MTSAFRRRLALAGVVALALASGARAAESDAVADFYKGKTITIVTSTGAGGAYDLGARALGRYMSKYLPGAPQFVVKNMPGGGHVVATNFMFNQAPKDGTFIATVINAVPMIQALGTNGVRFDARKFDWIGSMGTSNLLTVAWAASGVKTIDDVFRREVVTGATGTGSGTFLYPTAMNAILGTKFKVVLGYASSAEVDLAMTRGEVVARGGASYRSFLSEHPDWMKNHLLNALVQVGAKRDPDLPDVPLMHELGKTPEDQRVLRLISSSVAMGKPFLAPPGTPPDRLAALRRAFDATMKDPGFVAEAEKLELDLNPATGDEIARVASDTIDAPADLVARARAAVDPEAARAR